MGDEMKQAETGMPSLTLEPDFAPEVKVQGQLMEVAPEMDPVQLEDFKAEAEEEIQLKLDV